MLAAGAKVRWHVVYADVDATGEVLVDSGQELA
jgi:hypothetical protein